MNGVTGPRRQSGQVLIAIFLVSLLFGGAGLSSLFDHDAIKRLHKAVNTQVQEPERREALASVLDNLDAAATGYTMSYEHVAKRLLESLGKHETRRVDVERILTELDALDRFSREALLERRMQLREQLSAAEWGALFPRPPDAEQSPTPREAVPRSNLAPLQRRSLPHQVVSVRLRQQ